MSRAEKWIALGGLLAIGGLAGAMAKKEAAALGLTALELGLLTMATGAYVARKLG